MESNLTEATALDEYLAVHLFGWRWVRHSDRLVASGSSGSPGVRFLCDAENAAKLVEQDIYAFADDSYPVLPTDFSRSQPAATGDGMLAVLEAMTSRGYFVSITGAAVGFACYFAKGPIGTPAGVTEQTLPLAVARAAKAALEAESAG